MSEPNTSIKPLSFPSNQTRKNACVIAGRIEVSRREQGQNGFFYLTLIRQPAPDEFSMPGTVEITSSRPLGQKGEEIEVNVQVTGIPRPWNRTDKQTGEVIVVRTANNRLTAIED